jgi:hypothetical protein
MSINTRPPSHAAEIEHMPVTRLRAYARNARTHSRRQIQHIADSIRKFGFTSPVLISDEDEIIAGHGRVEAAKLLGMQSVPTLRLSHLDATQRRAYVIADNKLALNAGWDREVLAIELKALVDMDFDVESTGFSLAEVDVLLDESPEGSPRPDDGPIDCESAVSRPSDLWLLDRHRLLCGDSGVGYCDQIIRRFEGVSGKQATLAQTGQSFGAVAAERSARSRAAESVR